MTAPSSNAPFPATKWSLVVDARGGGAQGRAALAELCQAYWMPLYAFARRSGRSPADAEDLVQGFLAKAVPDQLFARADAERGKLRTFLLTAFRRYDRDEYCKRVAEKRGGGAVVSLDLPEAERWYAEIHAKEAGKGTSDGSPERAFDRQWALTLLERTCLRLQRTLEARGRGEEFAALRRYLTAEANAADYARLGQLLGMKPDSAKVAVHRLRARFGAMLREEVRETHADEGDVDAELRYLIQLL